MQLEPVLHRVPEVRSARVLVMQQGPLSPPEAGRLVLWIVYSTLEEGDLEETAGALAEGTIDPNLPTGVTLQELYALGQLDGTPRIAYMNPSMYLGQTRDPAYGQYEFIDGFAEYGTFVRGASGAVTCQSYDASFSGHLDRYL